MNVALAEIRCSTASYAFGGGGSGDSTRGWNSVATYTGALNGEIPTVRRLAADRSATLLEHVFIGGQQSDNG